MLKNYIISLLMLLSASSTALSAQELSARDTLQQRLSNLDTFQSAFVQDVRSASGELLQQASGTLSIAKPTYLDWQVIEPDETRLLSKDDVVYLIDPFLEQVSIYDLGKMIENNPLLLLLSDDVNQWENFSVVQQNQNNDKIFEVSAKSPNAIIQALTLKFADEVLLSMSFVDTQQQVSTFVFHDAKINVVLPADTFSYIVPDTYTIDDQRAIDVPNKNRP